MSDFGCAFLLAVVESCLLSGVSTNPAVLAPVKQQDKLITISMESNVLYRIQHNPNLPQGPALVNVIVSQVSDRVSATSTDETRSMRDAACIFALNLAKSKPELSFRNAVNLFKSFGFSTKFIEAWVRHRLSQAGIIVQNGNLTTDNAHIVVNAGAVRTVDKGLFKVKDIRFITSRGIHLVCTSAMPHDMPGLAGSAIFAWNLLTTHYVAVHQEIMEELATLIPPNEVIENLDGLRAACNTQREDRDQICIDAMGRQPTLYFNGRGGSFGRQDQQDIKSMLFPLQTCRDAYQDATGLTKPPKGGYIQNFSKMGLSILQVILANRRRIAIEVVDALPDATMDDRYAEYKKRVREFFKVVRELKIFLTAADAQEQARLIFGTEELMNAVAEQDENDGIVQNLLMI